MKTRTLEEPSKFSNQIQKDSYRNSNGKPHLFSLSSRLANAKIPLPKSSPEHFKSFCIVNHITPLQKPCKKFSEDQESLNDSEYYYRRYKNPVIPCRNICKTPEILRKTLTSKKTTQNHTFHLSGRYNHLVQSHLKNVLPQTSAKAQNSKPVQKIILKIDGSQTTEGNKRFNLFLSHYFR